MRRKDREIISFEKMIQIMKNCDCCRIGLVDGDEAYIVPMNFGYDINEEQVTLYFHCAKQGRKINLIPLQKSVCFEMDTKHKLVTGDEACDYTYFYQSIMGKGKLETVSGDEEKVFGMRKIMAHYSDKENWNFDQRVFAVTEILKLTVNSWSCKQH